VDSSLIDQAYTKRAHSFGFKETSGISFSDDFPEEGQLRLNIHCKHRMQFGNVHFEILTIGRRDFVDGERGSVTAHQSVAGLPAAFAGADIQIV